MPEKQQTITLTSTDLETNLAISYQAFKLLNWTIKQAVDNIIVGYTQRKWYKYEHEITGYNTSINAIAELVLNPKVNL